jgi:regulator of protease activity HflC (stomatin/prohibitin superfamily)
MTLELVYGIGAAALLLLALVVSAVRIVPEYERGVILRLGRVIGTKGPGLFFIIPIVDRMKRVNLQTVTMVHTAPGRNHQGQRDSESECRDVLQRRGAGEGGDRHPAVHVRYL